MPRARRLKFVDNWGYHEYHTSSGKVDWEMTHAHLTVDGETHTVELARREGTETVSDHGKEDRVRSPHYFVKGKFFGIDMEIPLNEIIAKKGVSVYVEVP